MNRLILACFLLGACAAKPLPTPRTVVADPAKNLMTSIRMEGNTVILVWVRPDKKIVDLAIWDPMQKKWIPILIKS